MSELTYKSSNTFHNYGEMIFQLAPKNNWKKSTSKIVSLSNKNSQSRIKCYLDGMECITLKHNLSNLIQNEKYSPLTFSLDLLNSLNKIPKGLYFVKPSHEYIGSGKDIYITSDPKSLELDPKLEWVVQKEIKAPLFNKKKWDIRHYALVLYDLNSISFYAYSDLFARVNPLDHDPQNHLTQLTNISLTEQIDEYSPSLHMIKCHDGYFDKLKSLVFDVLKKSSECAKPAQNEIGYLVLGFDTMFTNDTKNLKKLSPTEIPSEKWYPVLIEVNAQPSMEISNTVEGEISIEFWNSLLKTGLPAILKNKKINDFDKFHFLFRIDSKTRTENTAFEKPKYIPENIKQYTKKRHLNEND